MNGNGSPHSNIDALIALQSLAPDNTMVALGGLMDMYAGKEYGGKIKGGIPMHMPRYADYMGMAGMGDIPIIDDAGVLQILNKLLMGDVPGGLVSYFMTGQPEPIDGDDEITGGYSPASKYYPDVPDTIKIWSAAALEHEPIHSIGKHHTESGELSQRSFDNYEAIMFDNLTKSFGGYRELLNAKKRLMAGKDIRPMQLQMGLEGD